MKFSQEKILKDLEALKSDPVKKDNAPESNNSNLSLKLYPDMDNQVDVVESIPLNILFDSSINCFSKMNDEDFQELKGSILEYGIISPLSVRRITGGFEIISGHNRKRALAELGINSAPCVVKENISDAEASILIGIANKQRSANILDWAMNYRTSYDLLKKDKNENLSKSQNGTSEKVEQTDDENNKDLSKSQNGTSVRTDQYLADKYGVSRNKFNRILRLSYLTNNLAEMLMAKKINKEQAEQLSYLKADEQDALAGNMYIKGAKMTLSLAKELREASQNKSEDEMLTTDEMCRLLDTAITEDPFPHYKKYSVKVNPNIFPKEMKEREKPLYIEKALEYIKENNIEL